MRAGLIVAGVFLMIIGFLLTLTIIGALLGIPIGFIGFIMMLVGLLTSGTRVVHVGQQQQQQVVVVPQPQPPAPQPSPALSALGKAVLKQLRLGVTETRDIAKSMAVEENAVSDAIVGLFVQGFITKERRLTATGFEVAERL